MYTCNDRPKQEAYEELVSLESNTVAGPWTMMIHSHDTLSAYAAMMRSWGFQHFAGLAYSESHEAIHSFIYIYFVSYIVFFCGLFVFCFGQ